MAFETPGITGEVIWTSVYNSKIGYYPPDCLPSTYCYYFSAFAYAPLTNPYLPGADAIGFSPGGAIVSSAVFPFGLQSADIAKWNTVHRYIFSQVDYRINEPIILTQKMITDSEIELPNYIFEFVSVTKSPIEIPPWIKPLPKTLDFNITNKNSNYKFQLSASLVFETAVSWRLGYICNNNSTCSIDSSYLSIDKNGLITIYPAGVVQEFTGKDANTGKMTLKVTAFNSMGEDYKLIDITINTNKNKKDDVTSSSIEELESLEKRQDILWKKITDKKNLIAQNKFTQITKNILGMYFRLDNSTAKSIAIGKNANYSSQYTATSNDATSKKFTFDATNLKVGDTLYLTYCAVKEHYMRQVVNINWMAIDEGIFGFVAYPTSVNAANYRFLKWEVPTSKNTTTTAEGWRCVETFNMKPHILGVETQNIDATAPVNFMYGEQGIGNKSISYSPATTTVSDIINTYFDGEKQLPTYNVRLISLSDSEGYMFNTGIYQSGAYIHAYDAEWYKKYIKSYPRMSYADMIEHCVYNVSPEALKKRDADKYAIPISVANALNDAINNGENTYLPFMDDPTQNNPTEKCTKTLNSSNFLIRPIASSPQVISTTNVGFVSTPIGLFPRAGVQGQDATGIVYGEFRSNIIKESFKKGTRVLIETKPVASRGSVVLSIKCKSNPKAFVDCLIDNNYNNIYLISNNKDGFLSKRLLMQNDFNKEISLTVFDPEKGGINYTKTTINPTDYPIIGYSGLLGDSPGHFPTQAIGFYNYAVDKAFIEFYTSKSLTEFTNKKQIAANYTSDTITIQLERYCYTNKVTVQFSADVNVNNNISAALVFMSGNSIESEIDNFSISKTSDNNLILDYPFLKGDSIQIKFSGLTVKGLKNVSVTGIEDTYADDFTSRTFSYEQINNIFGRYDGPLFIRSNFASSIIDDSGQIYVFFEDAKDGISCINTANNTLQWNLQYGIIPTINNSPVQMPLCLKAIISKTLFLFFMYNQSIYCTPIDLKDFSQDDAFKLNATDENDLFIERIRNSIFFLAAGKSDRENIEFILKTPRFSLGYLTTFSSVPVDTPYFSAYECKNGELRLNYLDSYGKWQCNFSHDNGITWTDLWLCMNNQLDIGNPPTNYIGGIRVYPTGEDVAESLFAHYVWSQDRLYLFYIYKGCLLCKKVENPRSICILKEGQKTSYQEFQELVENAPSTFIDGNVANIEEQIYTEKFEKGTKEIFLPLDNLKSAFSDYRTITAQRISVYQMPNGTLRVFYKTSNDDAIRSAFESGLLWAIDDMHHPAEVQT